MTVDTLALPVSVWDRLASYLHAPHERMAFLLAAPTGQATWSVSAELYLSDELDYAYQGRFGMELADHVRPQVLRWAHEAGAALVEVHAHDLPGPTTFSPTDLDGLEEVVPQMLWRLPGRPYIAVVIGPDSLDALVWHAADAAHPLDAVRLGDTVAGPTGLAAQRLAGAVTR
jgi:hypothetical protein